MSDSDKHLAFIDESITLDAESIQEGWEKLVMSKLFEIVFKAPNTDESRSDYVLQKKIETYAWIEERHLDLNFSFGLTLEMAQAELLRMNGFRSPKDKLIIFHNVLQLLVDLIKKRGDGSQTSTDSLLPTLILVIIRAKPANMISNVKYVMRYRNAKIMEQGENQYCLTNYVCS